MKYLETHILSEEERQIYEQKGLYCYDLRSSDFGGDIASIEKRVIVNRIGSMITNEKIEMGDQYPDNYIDYEDFISKNENVSTIEKLKEDKVLLEYGDVIEYKGFVIEIDDTNPDNHKETLVQIFETKEDYDSGNYNEIVSLNTINLEKNIKAYVDSNYQIQDNAKLDTKEYITFILGYDLLNKDFNNSKTPECDIVYDFCNKLSDKFVNTECYKNNNISLYEALEKWVEANKSSIKKDFEKFSGVKSEKNYER